MTDSGFSQMIKNAFCVKINDQGSFLLASDQVIKAQYLAQLNFQPGCGCQYIQVTTLCKR